MFGFPYIDSPCSVDSGVGRSPSSSCDRSGPSSPSSPMSPEDGFQYMESLKENTDVGLPDILQGTEPQEKSSATLPAEKTVKKLLELLVAAKTAGERSLISNLLTTLVSNSLKRDDTYSNCPTNLKSVVEQNPRRGRKRPATPCIDQTPHKERKTVMKTPAPVKPSIIMVEQPEQVCANFVLGSNRLFLYHIYNLKINVYKLISWCVYLCYTNNCIYIYMYIVVNCYKIGCCTVCHTI